MRSVPWRVIVTRSRRSTAATPGLPNVATALRPRRNRRRTAIGRAAVAVAAGADGAVAVVIATVSSPPVIVVPIVTRIAFAPSGTAHLQRAPTTSRFPPATACGQPVAATNPPATGIGSRHPGATTKEAPAPAGDGAGGVGPAPRLVDRKAVDLRAGQSKAARVKDAREPRHPVSEARPPAKAAATGVAEAVANPSRGRRATPEAAGAILPRWRVGTTRMTRASSFSASRRPAARAAGVNLGRRMTTCSPRAASTWSATSRAGWRPSES